MHSFIEKVLFSNEDIVNRSKELGKQLTKDYEGKNPVVVGLLKGSIPFMAEIIKHIDCDLELDFLEASSYAGTESTNVVSVTKDVKTNVKGRHVLICEDIVDTGLTLFEIERLFKDRGCASFEIVCLLDKPEGRTIEGVNPKYIGFTIPKAFVVGFGLDYDQKYRNLDYIGILKPEVYTK